MGLHGAAGRDAVHGAAGGIGAPAPRPHSTAAVGGPRKTETARIAGADMAIRVDERHDRVRARQGGRFTYSPHALALEGGERATGVTRRVGLRRSSALATFEY